MTTPATQGLERPSVPERALPPTRRSRLWPHMTIAIAVVAALAWWDARRESRATLAAFSEEQARVAVRAAQLLDSRLEGVVRDARVLAEADAAAARAGYLVTRVRAASEPALAAPAGAIALHVPVAGGRVVDLVVARRDLFRDLRRDEVPGELVMFVASPGATLQPIDDGAPSPPDALDRAVASGEASTWVGRDVATSLGLPSRRAAVGFGRVDAGALGVWRIAAIATAAQERSREERANARLLGSVALASGLVFFFGSLARRRERKELELERALAVERVRRERDERLARASRVAMMGTLASGVAHEIATPLGVIAGRAELLLSRLGDADDKTRKALGAILEQSTRIEEVVRGFLGMARGGRPALVDVDPRAIVASAVRLVEHRFDKAGVRLRTEIAADVPAVAADARLLEHAIVNLLLNASQAAPRGGHVDVRVAREEGMVSFEVDDDGPGMSEADAERAMEPFFTTKPESEGTGLGLAITHEIVKAHRGTLTFARATPHGTRARIAVPVRAEVA